ncbi:MAG: LptF/LptG family permease [Puniceicoccales bacterium]|nr:LptF/LptG family permease [Puniceicoccales bacterium]
MKLYERYILRKTLITCVAAVSLFVGVLLVANAIRDVVEWIAIGRLTLLDSVKVLWLLIPSAISYALPLGMMSGVLIVVGRMSLQNEILAMKGIGIGLTEIVRPIFLLAIVSALLSAYVNLYHAPNAVSEYRQAFRKIVRDKPMRFIVPKTFSGYFPGYVIYVDGLSNGNFSGMKIWQFGGNENLDMYIFAKSGKIMFDGETEAFTLELHDGNAEKFIPGISPTGQAKLPQIMFFKNISVNLPATSLVGGQSGGPKKLHYMNLRELLATKRDLNSGKSHVAYDQIRHRKNLVNMQISWHIANAVGILPMALLAIPLGLRTARAETAFNTGLALALCLGYYFAMTVFSLFWEDVRFHPEILIWVPNIVLMALGISLFNRASRH